MSLSGTNLINLFALNTQNILGRNQSDLGKSIEKLSSGLGINHSSDNPSGLAISEKMRSYISGLKRASLNAQDGTSYLQTAEGATNEITSMIQRMRELAVQSSNGTYTSNDRFEIQKEMDQLKEEVDRISQSSEFNTKKLLNGESAGAWNSSTERVGAIITGTVADGNYDVSVDVTPGKNQILQSQILALKDGALGAEIAAKGGTNISTVRNPEGLQPSKDHNYSVNVGNAITAGDSVDIIGSYAQDGSLYIPGPITASSSNASGYMIIEFTETSDTAGAAGTSFRAKFVSAETGVEGGWMDFTTGVNGSLSATYTANGFNVSFAMPVTSGVDSSVNRGDKFLLAVTDNKGMQAGADLLISGGGTLQLERNGVKGPTVTYAGIDSLTKADNKDGIEDINEITLHTVGIDAKTGNIDFGQITLGLKENSSNAAGHGITKSGSMTMEVRGGGEAATSTTKLADIINFVDPDGNEILSNSQEIRIYGNSKYATIQLEGSDTLEDVARKITDAIVKDLGMGSNDAAINDKLVEYVPTSSGNGMKSIRGTMLIQTALTGTSSELSFIGGQSIIDALGLSQIQKSVNNISKVTVTDHFSGALAGETVTDGNRVKNLIPGVDITIDTRTGSDPVWNPSTDSIDFVKSTGLDNYNMNLHIVDNRTKIQIGVRKGESIDVSIPQLDTTSLGISNAVITSQEDAQKAISALDGALTKVNSVRSTIGAQINRLDSAYSSLQDATTNMTASESRIRDVDVAAETTRMTTAQVMTQAGLSILAQANQLPSMALSLLQS